MHDSDMPEAAVRVAGLGRVDVVLEFRASVAVAPPVGPLLKDGTTVLPDYPLHWRSFVLVTDQHKRELWRNAQQQLDLSAQAQQLSLSDDEPSTPAPKKKRRGNSGKQSGRLEKLAHHARRQRPQGHAT